MSHVVFAAYGSAGDMFPSLAVARVLRSWGHRETLLTAPSSALIARKAGVPVVVIGSRSDVRAASDPGLLTTCFDGCSSWRRLADRYIEPVLREGYDGARSLIGSLDPDVFVVHPFAPYGSLMAAELGVPCVSLHLYPQLTPGGRPATTVNFGGRLPRIVRAIEHRAGLARRPNPLLHWSWSDVSFSVHDPAFLDRTRLADVEVGERCGFPYWDDIPGSTEELDGKSIRRGSEPVVVSTFGSFLGAAQRPYLERLSDTIGRLRWSAVVVGVPPALRAQLGERPGITFAGYVPLSRLAPSADVYVHHGGIGTMYAGLLAGTPSIVLPDSFDHTLNRRLLRDAGVGLALALGDDLEHALRALADDGGAHEQARALARALAPPATASRVLATRIIEAAGDVPQPASGDHVRSVS